MKRTRKFKNYFLHPEFFLKYWSYLFFSSGITFLGFFGVVLFHKKLIVETIITMAGHTADPKILAQLEGLVSQMILIYLVFSIGIVIISLFMALTYSHRISGPTVSILRFISKLADGDFGGTLKTRPEDQLSDLVDDLNDLRLVLENKRSQK